MSVLKIIKCQVRHIFQDECFAVDRMQLDWQQLQLRGGNPDEKSLAAIAAARVLDSRDAATWDWDLVASALRNPPVQGR